MARKPHVNTDKQLAAKLGTAKISEAKRHAVAAEKKAKQDAAMLQMVADVDQHDLTIPLSANYLEGTEKDRPKKRRYMTTEDQISYITKAGQAKDFSVILSSFERDAAKLQWQSACLCTAVAYRVQKDKKEAVDLANEFFKAVMPLGKSYTMIRTEAIKAWLLEFAALDWDKMPDGKTEGFVYSGKKHSKWASSFGRSEKGQRQFIIERMSQPYWLFTPEKEEGEIEFILADKIESILKTAEKHIKRHSERPEIYGKYDVEGIDKVKELLRTLNKSTTFTRPSTENDAEESSIEVAV